MINELWSLSSRSSQCNEATVLWKVTRSTMLWGNKQWHMQRETLNHSQVEPGASVLQFPTTPQATSKKPKTTTQDNESKSQRCLSISSYNARPFMYEFYSHYWFYNIHSFLHQHNTRQLAQHKCNICNTVHAIQNAAIHRQLWICHWCCYVLSNL